MDKNDYFSAPWDTTTTISFMEIQALRSLTRWLILSNTKNKNIYIYCDSLVSLRWIKCVDLPKYYRTYIEVQNIIQDLNDLSTNNKIHLLKVRSKWAGNKEADRLAKEAAQKASLDTYLAHTTTYQTTKAEVKQYMRNRHKAIWITLKIINQ